MQPKKKVELHVNKTRDVRNIRLPHLFNCFLFDSLSVLELGVTFGATTSTEAASLQLEHRSAVLIATNLHAQSHVSNFHVSIFQIEDKNVFKYIKVQ